MTIIIRELNFNPFPFLLNPARKCRTTKEPFPACLTLESLRSKLCQCRLGFGLEQFRRGLAVNRHCLYPVAIVEFRPECVSFSESKVVLTHI
jgi:hypothetical protein